jgi:hypothetical protein
LTGRKPLLAAMLKNHKPQIDGKDEKNNCAFTGLQRIFDMYFLLFDGDSDHKSHEDLHLQIFTISSSSHLNREF